MLRNCVKRAKQPTTPTDAELLDLHYKELAMPRQRHPNPPEPPNDPSPEEELEEEEPGEEEEPEEEEDDSPSEPAEASPDENAHVTPSAGYAMPTPPEGEPKRRVGRPRGSKTKSRATGVAKDSSFTADGIVSATRWPVEASAVWEKILREVAPQKQYGPDDVYILVYRWGVGAVSGQTFHQNRVYLTRIDGGSIAGNETVSPGEALTEYMETVVHPSSQGAARYELNFHRRAGSTIKVGEMQFAHPQEVARQRAAAAEHTARLQASGFGGPVGPMPSRGGYPPLPVYPQPYYPPPSPGFGAPAYYPPPPQDPAIRAEMEAVRREVATVLGRFDEQRAREAEKRGEPPPPPIAAQVMTPVESEEMRIARVVRAVLSEAGISAKVTGVGAPPTVGVGVTSVTTQVKDGLGAFRDMMSMFKELDKFRREVGMAGVETEEEAIQAPNPIVEDPNSPAFGVKPVPFANFRGKPVMWPTPTYRVDEDGNRTEVDESFLEKAGKFGAANPELALAFLEGASKVLGQGAFGQLLQAFAAQGGGAAKAAAEMAGRSGVGSPNGAPPAAGFPGP